MKKHIIQTILILYARGYLLIDEKDSAIKMIYRKQYEIERNCAYVRLPRLTVCYHTLNKRPFVFLSYPDGHGAVENVCLSTKELPELD